MFMLWPIEVVRAATVCYGLSKFFDGFFMVHVTYDLWRPEEIVPWAASYFATYDASLSGVV